MQSGKLNDTVKLRGKLISAKFISTLYLIEFVCFFEHDFEEFENGY